MSKQEVDKQTNSEEPRIGVFVCQCGSSITSVIDVNDLINYTKTLPQVTYVEQMNYPCSHQGQANIVKAIK